MYESHLHSNMGQCGHRMALMLWDLSLTFVSSLSLALHAPRSLYQHALHFLAYLL